MANVPDIFTSLAPNAKLVITVGIIILLIAIIVVLGFYIWNRRQEKVLFDTLVEVFPEWAGVEKLASKEGISQQELDRLKEKYSAEYYLGGLLFDEKRALYFLVMKDGRKKIKTVIDNPYVYARPIHAWKIGKYPVRRVITLYRASPHDYKPVKVKIEGATEVKDVIDTESMTTHFIIMEQLKEKYMKLSGLAKYKELVLAGVMIFIGIILLIGMVYFANKNLEASKLMSQAVSQLAKTLKATTP